MVALHLMMALVACWFWAQCTVGNPIDLTALGIQAEKRADAGLIGYLGAFFLGADPYVYFYLSNGNNAVSFKSLNGGNPILQPTVGTGGVRDPAIVTGGGTDAGKKWYIVGTDLDIDKVSTVCLRISWNLRKSNSPLRLPGMLRSELAREVSWFGIA
jgi:hypothetical protein